MDQTIRTLSKENCEFKQKVGDSFKSQSKLMRKCQVLNKTLDQYLTDLNTKLSNNQTSKLKMQIVDMVQKNKDLHEKNQIHMNAICELKIARNIEIQSKLETIKGFELKVDS